MTPAPRTDTDQESTPACTCGTSEADCLDCRSCLSHHDLDDCDNWSEWTAKGWH